MESILSVEENLHDEREQSKDLRITDSTITGENSGIDQFSFNSMYASLIKRKNISDSMNEDLDVAK